MLEELEAFDEAIAAYQAAIDSGHADWAPAGHCGLGLLHGTQNRTHMGMRHLRAAYDSGHPEYHLEAAYWMGMFYWWDGTHGQIGALRNAATVLREVVDSGHSKWAAEAASALASGPSSHLRRRPNLPPGACRSRPRRPTDEGKASSPDSPVYRKAAACAPRADNRKPVG